MNEALEEMDKQEILISDSINKIIFLFQIFSCFEDKVYNIKPSNVYDDNRIQA